LDSDHPEVTQSELSILFCDDAKIQQLNRDYRGKDKPTDVLSFSAIENAQGFLIGASLGDLVISIPTARAQARKYRVSEALELLRLLIHGILHLFGYDHEKVAKSVAARMRRREKELLVAYRVEVDS
jgi:probable rRNA maturation factor